MFAHAETWVAVAFVVFIGILLYAGVHKTMVKSLDDRAKRIADELDEARRLREDAQRVLADYQRRRQEAEAEAQAIVAAAQTEAERLAAEAKTKAEEFVARRTKMAETKIAQAEAQAMAEVRGAAADAAVKAAEQILAARVKSGAGDKLLAAGIDQLRTKLH